MVCHIPAVMFRCISVVIDEAAMKTRRCTYSALLADDLNNFTFRCVIRVKIVTVCCEILTRFVRTNLFANIVVILKNAKFNDEKLALRD